MLGILRESLARKYRRDRKLNSQVCSYIQKGDLSHGRLCNAVNELSWEPRRSVPGQMRTHSNKLLYGTFLDRHSDQHK